MLTPSNFRPSTQCPMRRYRVGFCTLSSFSITSENRFFEAVLLSLVAMIFLFALSATATEVRFTFDENGFGYYQLNNGGHTRLQPMNGVNDPVTGKPAPLEYILPLGVEGNPTEGDVVFYDGPRLTQPGDILRFIPGAVLVYSDFESTGNQDTADVKNFMDIFDNTVRAGFGKAQEVGPEGNNFGTWNPNLATDPGFIKGFDVSYSFISDGTASPEPATFVQLLFGIAIVAERAMSRRRRASPRQL